MHHKIFLPHCGLGKNLIQRNRAKGRGMGSVLLDHGLGGQSSYSSVDEYLSTTDQSGRTMLKKGNGLANVSDKLENLIVKPIHKKIRNIKFNM